jgi:threonine/homoserine/homoserine lactone efflux protein
MNALPLIFGITWLAVISPGADFAMISRNSFLHGRRAECWRRWALPFPAGSMCFTRCSG